MKVFISHKQEDSSCATKISTQLRALGITSYLDVLDSTISGDGKQLTDHIKSALNDCTDILVVMSEHTRLSQWVYFEVGMSAQIDMPTVTYLESDVALPGFLSYWPRLKRISDLATYIMVRNRTRDELARKYSGTFMSSAEGRAEEILMFYSSLKSQLK